MSPVISVDSSPHVHHMLVYLCDGLEHAQVGTGNVCVNAHINIQYCRSGGTLIGGWAVGGTVSLCMKVSTCMGFASTTVTNDLSSNVVCGMAVDFLE